MDYIRSRKHAVQPATRRSATAAALAALAIPAAVHAQGTPQSTAQATPSEQALPEVKVKGNNDAPYKADTISSPKFTQPLVDTPQTITVIKKEVLQEQGAVSLSDALRNTPGITFLMGENGNTATGDSIFMRGFDTQGSIFVDGIRDLGTVTRDTYNIEQVEVVKGPAGADIGRGSPTGYINLVTKLPLAEDFSAGSVSVGSGVRGRATADLNRQLDLGVEGSAVRLNAMVSGRRRARSRRCAQGRLGHCAFAGHGPRNAHAHLPLLPARRPGQPPRRRHPDHRPAGLLQPDAGQRGARSAWPEEGRLQQLLRLAQRLRERRGRHGHRSHRARPAPGHDAAQHLALRRAQAALRPDQHEHPLDGERHRAGRPHPREPGRSQHLDGAAQPPGQGPAQRDPHQPDQPHDRIRDRRGQARAEHRARVHLRAADQRHLHGSPVARQPLQPEHERHLPAAGSQRREDQGRHDHRGGVRLRHDQVRRALDLQRRRAARPLPHRDRHHESHDSGQPT